MKKSRELFTIMKIGHLNNLLPFIRVHVWGGLGSQLFAINLLQILNREGINRNFSLTLHSSGVTKRYPAFTEIYPAIDYKFFDDFSNQNSLGNANLKFIVRVKQLLRKIIKKLAISFRFLIEIESSKDLRKIRVWTLSIRGHYSYLKVSRDFLVDLERRLLSGATLTSIDKNGVTLHYRLDDLMTLENKSFIPSYRIIEEINRVESIEKNSILYVYSDSIEAAKRLLVPDLGNIAAVFVDNTLLEVFRHGIITDYFIGTNSKISYWICGLRSINESLKETSLPEESTKDAKNVLHNLGSIRFY